MGNLGDDAIVAAAKSAMPSRRLIDLNYASRERNLAQLGLSGATYFESVILGGGTLISPNWLSTVKDALNLGAPMITLGTGVGSCGFQDGVNVDVAPWLPSLERFKAVGVRGPRSKAA